MTPVGPIHPGEHLAEILDELGISQYRLALAIGVPPRRINDIVRGRRSVTADTALRIGQALRMTPEFWLNLNGCTTSIAPAQPPTLVRSNRLSRSAERPVFQGSATRFGRRPKARAARKSASVR